MILDTNALSAIADGESTAAKQLTTARMLFLPVIVLGEYRFGLAQSRLEQEYVHWLNQFVLACQILNIDEETAVCYAQIRLELKRAGTPIPVNDAWIAALCRQHTTPVLSRDRHFDLVEGIRRLEW